MWSSEGTKANSQGERLSFCRLYCLDVQVMEVLWNLVFGVVLLDVL